MIWPELKHVAKVEGRLLEMPIRFQDLTELKLMLVLNYCCLLLYSVSPESAAARHFDQEAEPQEIFV